MKTIGLLTTLFLMISRVYSQDLIEGEKLFNTNCKACHSIGGGKIVGPDLKNVTERRKEEWLLKFIKTPGAVIKSGDPDAKKLFEENNQVLMPDHAFLTDDKIKSMLAHIEKQSKEAVVEVKNEDQPKEEIVKPQTDKIVEANAQFSSMDYVLFTLIGICVVLILFAIVLIIQIMKYFKKVKL